MLHKLKKYIKKLFLRLLSSEDQSIKKKQEDYNFLIHNGVETQFGYVELVGKPIIQKHPDSRIVIGKNVILVSESTYNVAGINHSVILSTQGKNAEIIIGDGTGISGTSLVAVNKIVVGQDVKLGANTNIFDTDFHPLNSEKRRSQKSITDALSAPVIIGDNVWIGINSTVLKGVVIGNNSIIGAHSLVIKDIPQMELHAGVPAKFIKTLD